jgi:hypothetical protein
MPLAILLLIFNAARGAVCGLFAMGLQNLQGVRSSARVEHPLKSLVLNDAAVQP